jgi:hypothetical protein
MQTFALSPNDPNNVGDNLHINDLIMQSNGQLQLVTGVYSAAQSISNALQLWLGEYDFNTSVGVPYGIIFNGTQNNQALIELQVRNTIMSYNNYLPTNKVSIDGVKKIKSLSFTYDNTARKFVINAQILMNNNNLIEVTV